MKKIVKGVMAICAVTFLFLAAKVLPVHAATTVVNERENNNVVGKANQVTVTAGNTVEFRGVTTKYDNDFIKVVLPKSGILKIDETFYDDDSILSVLYKGVEADVRIEYYHVYYEQNLGYCRDVRSYYLSAGTYYINHNCGYNVYAAGNYTIKFSFTSAGENKYEKNDLIRDASPYTLGETARGMIACIDTYTGSEGRDFDYYKVVIPKSGSYDFTFSHNTSKDALLKIYNPNGDAVKDTKWFYGNYQGIYRTETISMTLNKGTYYFLISPADYHIGFFYNFKLTPRKVSQYINGSSSFNKTYGNGAFSLGASSSIKAKLSYKSSNTKVATVSSAGKVTIKGTGRTTITITAPSTLYYNGASKKVTITVVPKKQGIKSLSSPKKSELKVSWDKDTRASGYQITYAKNSKFTNSCKTITISSNKTTRKQIGKLSRGKKYYVKVRSYIVISGKKYYGAYSSAKIVKVK